MKNSDSIFVNGEDNRVSIGPKPALPPTQPLLINKETFSRVIEWPSLYTDHSLSPIVKVTKGHLHLLTGLHGVMFN